VNLQQGSKRGGFHNLITMLVNFIITIGGLFKGDLIIKLVCFGVDNVIIFQGLKMGVTM
jgi:hypothetical protein